MVDFAGWSMPTLYTSIRQEHLATRSSIGLFDISHMGRFLFSGPDAGAFLDSLNTRRVFDMSAGQIRYGLLCNEQGGILDDVLVYRLTVAETEPVPESGPQTATPHQWWQSLDADSPQWDSSLQATRKPTFQMVVNAGNRGKITQWLRRFQTRHSVHIQDITCQTAMIAVQGPQALPLVDSLLECDLRALRYYRSAEGQIDGRSCFVSRTGYTGEDGCELIVRSEDAPRVWETLLEQGSDSGITPVGLAARDTLRLEAAMPLYGHELSEQIDPVQAGLGLALNLPDRDFVGRDAIERLQADGNSPVRIGLKLAGRRVPRAGQPIMRQDRPVGAVTSGTFSPTLETPIAMGYVERTASTPGEQLAVDIRGTQHQATVVPLPFYQRKKA
jgi:glycine cleavage system T protein (aminomethyltransferase)